MESSGSVAESMATLQGPAYSVTSEISHQHKFPEGGKLDVPSAPKEKIMHFPVPKDINPKSGFTMPPGALDKPPIPDTLSGKKKYCYYFESFQGRDEP